MTVCGLCWLWCGLCCSAFLVIRVLFFLRARAYKYINVLVLVLVNVNVNANV